jgi:hypothetical protein
VFDLADISCSLFEIAFCEPNQRDFHIGEDEFRGPTVAIDLLVLRREDPD